MNWNTETDPVPVAEINDAIDAHEPDGLTGAASDQLAAAKTGAKAAIAEFGVPDGEHVGVEFAGNTAHPQSMTIRIRQVEPPPEPVELGEEGASGPHPVKGGVQEPAIA